MHLFIFCYSTPVKPPEDIDEIDISHRGRLRKRRIIPNNVEDQMAVKRAKIKSEVTVSASTAAQPVIVQSGKTQLVDYEDIIRQLKNTGTNAPILIKTTQGGRTVLTSVLPVSADSNSNSSTTSIPALQTIRIVSPNPGTQHTVSGQVLPQAVKITLPSTVMLPVTSRAMQHPTIQNLLTGSVAGTKLLPKSTSTCTVTGTGQIYFHYVSSPSHPSFTLGYISCFTLLDRPASFVSTIVSMRSTLKPLGQL